MPDRDAFGNEIVPGRAAPVGAALPGQEPPRRRRLARSSRRARNGATPALPGTATAPRGRRVRRVLAWGVAGLVALGYVSAEFGTPELDASMERFREAQRNLPPSGSFAPSGPRDSPSGLGRGSFFETERFAAALAKVRAAGVTRVDTFSVRVDGVDVSLEAPGGRARYLTVDADGALEDRISSLPRVASGPVSPLTGLDPRVPERIRRAVAEEDGLPAAPELSMIFVNDGEPLWLVSVRDGPTFQADGSGRITDRFD